MADYQTAGMERAARRKRRQRIVNVVLLLLLLLVGASMDASLIPPWGLLARRPEQIGATFGRCTAAIHGNACVVDGDSLRLGSRQVRLVGVDAPELAGAKCPAERALGERAADRLVVLLNQGPFDLVAHRFDTHDKYGRELMLARRGKASIGRQLIDEGLAHRYIGIRRSWC